MLITLISNFFESELIVFFLFTFNFILTFFYNSAETFHKHFHCYSYSCSPCYFSCCGWLIFAVWFFCRFFFCYYKFNCCLLWLLLTLCLLKKKKCACLFSFLFLFTLLYSFCRFKLLFYVATCQSIRAFNPLLNDLRYSS